MRSIATILIASAVAVCLLAGCFGGWKDLPVGPDKIAFVEALKRNDVEAVRQLITKDPSLVNCKMTYDDDSPLQVTLDSPDMMRLLIELGAEISYVNKRGLTALSKSAANGNLTAMSILLENGAVTDHRNSEGRTALSFAASNGNNAGVEYLLTRDAAVNLADNNGDTPLHWVCRSAYTTWGSPPYQEDGFNAVGRLLLAHGATVTGCGKGGDTPLHLAAAKGREDLAQLLVASNANIEARDNTEATPLLWATGKATSFLVLGGANANASDNEGRTRLHYYEGLLETFQLLVGHGADVNAKTVKGLTPLHYQHTKNVAAYLIDQGANLNAQNDGNFTPLHYMVIDYMNDEEKPSCSPMTLARLYIERGADVNLLDKYGRNPLFYTVSLYTNPGYGPTLFNALIAAGSRADIVDYEGVSPVHYAAGVSFYMLQTLIEHGAPVNPRTQRELDVIIETSSGGFYNIYTGLPVNYIIQHRFPAGVTPLTIAKKVGLSSSNTPPTPVDYLIQHGGVE
ncbi:MAG: Ankyrin repeats (3 copies) [bacterium ADurb.Bin429]|nr:MAG: Ankyrin repeats (3 copies) [bacterium ADurb.Bin429]